METAIIVAIIAAISSSGVSSLIIYLLQRKDREKERNSEKDDAKTKMLLGLAHECIISRGEYYIERGYITRPEYEDLNDYLYKPYKALGGNGTAERVMNEIEQLPTARP